MAYTGFTIPDLADAPFSTQAKVASEDWQIVADGLRGNGVQSGCVVAQRAAGANMSCDVSAGTINREGTAIAVTSGNLVIAAADATNPRIDIVHVNNAGTKAVTTGTPSSAPAPPAIPQVAGINNIVLAFVYVPAGDTTINTTQIVDKRALVNAPGGGAGTGTVTTSGTPATGNLTQFSGSTVITNGNLSGDVTTAGALTTTIAANAVSYAKIQDVSVASRLLGRGSSGSGDPQEITLGTNLSMSGTTLNATGGGGSTPTGTGFPHITGGTQDAAAKLVDTADLNNAQVTYAKIQNVSAASKLLGRGDSGSGVPQEITLGTNLSMSGTTLNATGGGGTTPTGTGFTHITAGAQDAAAKLVDTADVGNDQITYAKQQNVSAASRLLGRGSAAGAGDPEEILLGAGLTMTGTTLSAPTGGGGTVTTTGTPASGNLTTFSGASSITNGNLSGDVTTAGTLATTIAAGAVTYAKMQDVSAASRLVGRGSAAGAGDPQEITLGTNLSMSGTTLNAAGGGGSSDVVVALAADVNHTTNSITLENITGFAFPVTSSPTEIWKVEVFMLTQINAAGGNSAKFKFGWTFPAGVTGFWASQIERELASTQSQVPAPSITATLAFAGTGTGTVPQGIIEFKALIASNGNAGTVQLQFAQIALMAGAVNTIKRTSTFIARKVAS